MPTLLPTRRRYTPLLAMPTLLPTRRRYTPLLAMPTLLPTRRRYTPLLAMPTLLPTRRRYTPSLLAMPTLLQRISPACYKQMCNDGLLTLPTADYLRRLCSAIDTDIMALTEPTLAYLRARYSKLSEKDKLVSVAGNCSFWLTFLWLFWPRKTSSEDDVFPFHSRKIGG